MEPARLLCPLNSPGKNTGVGMPQKPFLSPMDLPDPWIKPRSPALQADSLPSKPPVKSHTALDLGNYFKNTYLRPFTFQSFFPSLVSA